MNFILKILNSGSRLWPINSKSGPMHGLILKVVVFEFKPVLDFYSLIRIIHLRSTIHVGKSTTHGWYEI